MTIQTIVEDFVGALEEVITARVRELALAALDPHGHRAISLDAFRIEREQVAARARRSNGTPHHREPVAARRKGPVQLCPVPGCKNRAAPVFGMVCADHKDLPKVRIEQYREARRATKSVS